MLGEKWQSQYLSLYSMVLQVAEVGKDSIGLRVSSLQFRWSTSKELSGKLSIIKRSELLLILFCNKNFNSV